MNLSKDYNPGSHSALPDASTASEETFPVSEAEKKLKELEEIVSQITTELKVKNRELEIEAALERVRARSMAMHRSDELKDVIKLVLEQFIQLSINAQHAGFYIDYKAHDDMHIWLADPNLEPFFVTLPYFDTPTWNSFLAAKAKGTIFHTDLLDFNEKNKFYNALFKLFTVPDKAKEFYMQCKWLAVSTVLLDSVGLYIENFEAIPYSEEENRILLRFGKVFQQSYTRFLDLQKAEAQSRESQIQLALERVRAGTDENIGKINIVPQDIGRVLLNLFNNAFYAVKEKMKKLDQNSSQVYVPRVIVTTHKFDDTIEITVSDNGNGIPDSIKEKIFQPFFTTKPTGQGTGLGLSLSYDIVKAHGGEIRVETKEGEGSEFKIQLMKIS